MAYKPPNHTSRYALASSLCYEALERLLTQDAEARTPSDKIAAENSRTDNSLEKEHQTPTCFLHDQGLTGNNLKDSRPAFLFPAGFWPQEHPGCWQHS